MYFTSGRNLEVQPFTRRTIISLTHSVLLCLFTTVTQMFITLGGGNPFRHLHVEYLFLICHTFFILFRTIYRVPACCLFGHPSHQRQAGGVLGSPFPLFVAGGQARMPSITGRGASLDTKVDCCGYTFCFQPPI